MTHALDDFWFQLELATRMHAIEVRKAGTSATCSVCEELVETVEFKTPRLTSYGTAYTWRTRSTEYHRRACGEAYDARIAKQLDEHQIDLWAPTG